jgi:hypothetical protein|tara:strand:- start:861 stop:1253 length:393 start_codon:yes stop_codon:yes gene_type:complete
MAFAKSNLKLTQVQAVVRCTGTGGDSGTIDIDTDIVKSGETASSPTVNITRVHWNCDKNAAVTITRNSVDIMHVHGTGFTDWYGWVETTENDQDIDIAISNGDAVVWLELSKVTGFGSQQHQDQGTLGGN